MSMALPVGVPVDFAAVPSNFAARPCAQAKPLAQAH